MMNKRNCRIGSELTSSSAKNWRWAEIGLGSNRAQVAQLAAQPICNRQVGGSNPPLGSIWDLSCLRAGEQNLSDTWAARRMCGRVRWE